MNFASDNWAGATETVAKALMEASEGLAAAYGNDSLTGEVAAVFSDIFERDVAVAFVATGSAANSLALSCFMKPSGVILCHRDSHIYADECGAPEFLTSGAKLLPLSGKDGKLAAATVAGALAAYAPNNLRGGRAVAVSITQLSECGTAYDPDEIAAIAALARTAGVGLHMDGARFANALVTLGCTPAEMTWKAGVDVLSFGATKNGCWCAEAVVFFERERADGFDFMRARSGHRFSKARFVAAQFLGYFRDDHWLATARTANARAKRLAEAVGRTPGARLAWPVDGNEVFAVLDRRLAQRLQEEGAMFYEWTAGRDGVSPPLGDGEAVYRLVTSFATADADIDRFAAALEHQPKNAIRSSG